MNILKGIVSSVIGRVAIIAIIAIIGFVFRDRIGGAAADLQVGDCFDLPAQLQEIGEVPHHPCAEPHDAEAFLIEDYVAIENAPFPAQSEFDSWAAVHCNVAFTPYTGFGPNDAPNVSWGYLQPTSDGWSKGDKEMTCFLGHLDESKASVSYRVNP